MNLINLSFPPREMSVPPSYASFFWSNEGGRNSETERWEQGESNDESHCSLGTNTHPVPGTNYTAINKQG